MSNTITIKVQANVSEATKALKTFEKDVVSSTANLKDLQEKASASYTALSKQSINHSNTLKAIEKDRQSINATAEQEAKSHQEKMESLEKQGIQKRSRNSLMMTRDTLDAQIEIKKQKIKEINALDVKVGGVDTQDAKTKEAFAKQEADLQKHNEKLQILEKNRTTVIRSMAYNDEQATIKKIEAKRKLDIRELKDLESSTTKQYNIEKQNLQNTQKLNNENINETKRVLGERKKLVAQQKQEFKEYEKSIRDQQRLQKISTGQQIDADQKRRRKTELADLKKEILLRNKSTKALATNTIAKKVNASATGSMTNNLIRHLRQIETAVIAYYALSRAIQATIGVGLDVNKMVESNTFGIAALTSANTRSTDSLGNSLTAIEKFTIGQKLAKETMAQLRVESLKTPATFAQLTEIYQQATGQTLAMGDAFGTTVDSINKNTVVLAQRFSNIAGAIGQPMDRVKEEIRSALTGNVSTDSIISTMIFGSPTEANEQIKKAKLTANGLKDLFDLKFKPFDILGETKSYTKGFLAMQNAWEMTMADMVEKSGLFSDITDYFYDMSQSIIENQDDIIKGFDSIYEGGKQFVSVLDEVALALTAFYGAKGAIKGLDLINKGFDTAVGWTTVYDLKTRKATTSTKALVRQAKFLALANPFATWTIGITAVITGLYEIQKISEEMSKERHAKEVTRVSSRVSGITTATPIAEVTAAQQSIESQMIEFAKADHIKRNKDMVEKLADEWIRLSKILDGTTKKQEEAAEKLKDATEQATLLTKISLNKEVMKEIEKFSKKELTTLEKLQAQKIKWNDELKVLNEKLSKDINEDAQSQKILQEARSSAEDGIAATKREILKIELIEAQRQLGITQDLWVSEQKLLGVEVVKSEMIAFTIRGKKEELTLETDIWELKKQQKILNDLERKYNEAKAKELAKELKLREDQILHESTMADLIRQRDNTLQGVVLTDKQISDAKLEQLGKEYVLTSKIADKRKILEEIVKEQTVNKSANDELEGQMINYGQLLAESFQDAVQDAFDGGGIDMGRLTGDLASALGSSMMSASMSMMTKDMMTAIGGSAAGMAGGLLGGIALMGISSLFGGDDGKSDAQKHQEFIDVVNKQTNSIVKALDEQTKILTHFGDNLQALEVSTEAAAIKAYTDILKDELAIFAFAETIGGEDAGIDIESFEGLYEVLASKGSGLFKVAEENKEFLWEGALEKAILSLSEENIASIREYANSLLEIDATYKDLNTSLKDVYDSVNDNYYANLDLKNAQEEVALLIGEQTFSEYLSSTIEGLNKFGLSIADLESDLISTDIETQTKAIIALEEATGKSFSSSTGEALEYLESIELVGAAMVDEIKANEDMISSLEGTFESLQGTIDSLRGAAVGSAYTMDLYNQSMKETQSLLASGDTDAFMESLAKTQGLTSALMDESAFEEYGRTADIQMRFEQSKAANQFEAMQTDVQTEIDILKLIEENTRIPAEVMSDPVTTTAVNFIAPALNTGVDTVDFRSMSRTNSSSDTDLKKQNELLEANNKLLRDIIANQNTSQKTAIESRDLQAATRDIVGEESA